VTSPLADNLRRIRERIAAAAERVERNPDDVAILAVTKTFPVARIRDAMALGLRTFGENRVQEAIPKIEEIGTSDASWHLIGHLQSNKARFIEERFTMVQSIDSVAIAQTLGRRLKTQLEILIEVNVGEEPQKTGALPQDLPAIAEAIGGISTLQLRGLMTVAPMVSDVEEARPIFQRLRRLRDEASQRLAMPLPVLSMGMSDDYVVAVEEGATMLRLGRALFGPR